MTDPDLAPLTSWLIEPASPEVVASIDRLRGADDVEQVAIMPDVHLASDVCVGAVVATSRLIYPQAVGSDIGCGMAAVAFDLEAAAVDDERSAARLLAALSRSVPGNKHRAVRDLPPRLLPHLLSDNRLAKIAARDGAVQLGTLGRGNHFLELQADLAGRLWAMVHSGSRAIGQAIAAHHLARGEKGQTGLVSLDSADERGQAYLADAEWARRYAAENRRRMLAALEQTLATIVNAPADWSSLIHSDHNHVVRQETRDMVRFIHRKGAQSAAADEPGIVPGSMGTASFHTAGRGCEEALRSCSHGAGRRKSRSEARQRIGGREFARQTAGVWLDRRQSDRLRDEAPGAYKDVRRVMRSQRELARIVAELRPVLSYKGM